MKINTDPKKIEEVLSRGVEQVVDKNHLAEKLKSGKQLRVKLGVDPTSPNIHLGRSIPLLKLRDFQELGHQIVLIVGDFTGVIGDTSDKDSERPMLTHEQVKANMEGYFEQAARVIDIRKCEKYYNSEWLGKLNYHEIGEQADQFSVAEFIARENIKKRLEGGTRVSLREVLYPLMQGYDSVAMKADVELGGTDQWFNLLAGRKLQEHYKQEPQDILVGPLLEGTDGRKMSSSWGNTINLLAEPNDMFGKIMSIPDGLIIKYFTLATRAPMADIALYEKEIKSGGNPRDYKIKLAEYLTSVYHGDKEAKKALEYFVSTFSKKEIPDEMPEVSARDIASALVESKICKSKSEARQVIDQGGVKINEIKVEAGDYAAAVKAGDIVQKGSRWFVRIK
ncbi:MAG: tyrosine--tRNA ligase [Candidatus Magasanikbacteria bacterium]|nr:tyrosine--tRNA ligase [Candidatus Magasanikbacteria bacterium]